MASKQSTTPEFVLVYDSKKPTSLHARTEKECWAGHMRAATAEELERLKDVPHCKHCAKRVERDAAKAAQEAEEAKPARKPKRQPIPRNEAADASSDAQTAPVTA
jgi:hypothetical protein